MKPYASIVLTPLLCLFAASPAQAQEPAKLEPVVVTAGRIAENPKTVTQSVTVIPQEEIRKNQYQDVGDMLRNYGIQVDAYNPNNAASTIALRGIRTSLMGNDLIGSVLLLADGRRVGTDNISMIPLVNVERIEIIRGPAAVQYGTSAVSGVVNVITKRGKEQPEAFAEAGAGWWDVYRAQGGAAGMAGPVDFSGGISWLSAKDYKSSSGGTYHNTGVDRKLAYNLNLGLNFLDGHRLGFKALGVDYKDMGSPGAFQSPYESRSEFINRYNNSYDIEYQGGCKDFGLSWTGRWYDGRQWDFWDDHEKELTYFDTYKNVMDYQGAQGQVSFSKSFLTLTGGLDWLRYDGRTANDAYTEAQNSKYKNLGAFLLAKLRFFDDFIIFSGGFRNDEYKLRAGDESRQLSRNTPSAGVALNPFDWLTLRANYGESFRIPSTQELLGFPGIFYYGWYEYIGNPDLKPEEGKNWDAGFEIRRKSLNLGLTYFQTTYRNKIIADWNDPSGKVQFFNIAKIKTKGLEVQASYDAGSFFDWPFMLRPYLNLTHMLEFEDQDRDRAPNISRNDAGYGLQFAHSGWGLDADLRFTYHGRRLHGGELLGDNTIVDLFVSKTVWEADKRGKLSVKGEVRNMFNEKYATMQDTFSQSKYFMPGTSVFVGLRYEY